jgi:hypothetical protein
MIYDGKSASKITVVVIFVFNLLPRTLLLRTILLIVLLTHLLVLGVGSLWTLLFAGVSSGHHSLLLRLGSVQLVLAFKCPNFIFLLLFSQFFKCFLGFLEFLLLYLVVSLQLVFEIVQIAVLVSIGLLQLRKFLLQPFIFLHEGWLDSN